ncbi:hypothetical protein METBISCDRAFT_17086 [Metschnikowia bicuspidata]|uniref:RRM domain-containing protein n=1 Tax=Metschnikowia bicuspidata TaxID=27322 RepID=A0A4P9ZBE4_9ASCO|nr:hypothetical protein METBISCDRAFT_17086 [Metschnikowia bicuspidata]
MATERGTESKKEKRERTKEKKGKSLGRLKSSERPLDEDVDNNSDNEELNGDEIEIDLTASAPLSKKKQRQLKKGKLDLAKIARKNPPPKPATEDESATAAPSKSPFGVWIGNLSYDTTKEDVIRFIVAKTKDNDTNDSGLVVVEEKDITRMNLPKKGTKIKGFAYVDLPSSKHVDAVVALNESHLNNRNLLIKNSSSFEGRPEEHLNKLLLKNTPSHILFVGNLPFDVTDDLLDEHFKQYGGIIKIRMATFEDTGNCKGFAFIDFKDQTGSTEALKSKAAKMFINRKLRLEYGEDRSKRNPRKLAGKKPLQSRQVEALVNKEGPELKDSTSVPKFVKKECHLAPKRSRDLSDSPNKRMKSSVALATAQRASAAIVPSQGKKVVFD